MSEKGPKLSIYALSVFEGGEGESEGEGEAWGGILTV